MATKVSIRDIAKQCGISPATVSRILSANGYPVRQAVRDQVLHVAAELGYDYGASRRSALVKEIAILVPTTSNPFFAAIIDGIERAITKEGMGVFIANLSTGIPKNQEDYFLDSLLRKHPCGVIIVPSNYRHAPSETAQQLALHGIKVVLVDSPLPDSRFNCVSYDYRRVTDIGVEYLVRMGHRHIAYIGLQQDRKSRALHVEGFSDALRRQGLVADDTNVLSADGDEFDEASPVEAGEALSRRVLAASPMPTAVVAENDLVAMGLLRGFAAQGLRVPQDISVLGFDDSIFAEMFSPALTTVRLQGTQMGHMAAMLLLDDLHGGQTAPVNLMIEPQVIVRETVAPPAGFSGAL